MLFDKSNYVAYRLICIQHYFQSLLSHLVFVYYFFFPSFSSVLYLSDAIHLQLYTRTLYLFVLQISLIKAVLQVQCISATSIAMICGQN